MSPETPKTFRRSNRDLLGVPRSLIRSHGFTQRDLYREAGAKGPLDAAAKFLKTRVMGWVKHYFKSRIGGRYEFKTYAGDGNGAGVYPLQGAGPAVKVSVAGDWATGTDEASRIGRLIEKGKPDFTIHLGDVYYVGTKKEVLENMLGGQVDWPKGATRSFGLNGNHEMYARGKAYFENLLKAFNQGASYFALRNDRWLLIGLDTGYNSVGLPILEMVIHPSCALPDPVVTWLRDTVRVDQDTARGIVVLTHHQYYSGFEGGYEHAARQLQDLIQRPVLWLWGHEHRFALYGKARGNKATLEAYGRCLGHGGMPVEDIGDRPDRKRAQRSRLVFYDHREKERIPNTGILRIFKKDTPVGYNGYAELVFNGADLTIEHRDIDGNVVIRERWRVETGGRLRGVSIEQPVRAPGLVIHTDLNHAIA